MEEAIFEQKLEGREGRSHVNSGESVFQEMGSASAKALGQAWVWCVVGRAAKQWAWSEVYGGGRSRTPAELRYRRPGLEKNLRILDFPGSRENVESYEQRSDKLARIPLAAGEGRLGWGWGWQFWEQGDQLGGFWTIR